MDNLKEVLIHLLPYCSHRITPTEESVMKICNAIDKTLSNQNRLVLIYEGFVHFTTSDRRLIVCISQLPMARYSFLQQSELKQCRVNQFAKGSKQQHRI